MINSKMKAIILSAGEGKRLRPLTNEKPKSMVELFDKSLLDWQIEKFRDLQIFDISVVKGYKAESISIENVNYFYNSKFSQTNMVETLFCAKNKLEGDIIISYGDIIYEKNVLKKLLDDESDISVIIDKNWEYYWKMRFKNPLDDAESLILDKSNFIQDIGQPVKEIKEIQGQYIGLIKFQNKGTEILNEFYQKMKNEAKNGNNPLNSSLPFEKSYMTDLLQGLINEGNKIKAVSISNGWLELDSINDYNLYNNKLKNGTISELINLEKL
jgi:L-glutamine-phosphate cytidylyltransferase